MHVELMRCDELLHRTQRTSALGPTNQRIGQTRTWCQLVGLGIGVRVGLELGLGLGYGPMRQCQSFVCPMRYLVGWRDSLVVSVLDQRPRGRGFESRWLRAVATLCSAPWAWAYSTLHPFGVGK